MECKCIFSSILFWGFGACSDFYSTFHTILLCCFYLYCLPSQIIFLTLKLSFSSFVSKIQRSSKWHVFSFCTLEYIQTKSFPEYSAHVKSYSRGKSPHTHSHKSCISHIHCQAKSLFLQNINITFKFYLHFHQCKTQKLYLSKAKTDT